MKSGLKLEEIILSLLVPMDGQKPANPGLEKQLIADTKRHRYQVIVQGWEKGEKFVNSTLLHLEIKDDKFGFSKAGRNCRLLKSWLKGACLLSRLCSVFCQSICGRIRSMRWRERKRTRMMVHC